MLAFIRSPRRARRVVRGLAALTALMLVASNAVAAMGLCAAKAPAPLPTVLTSQVQAQVSEAPCPFHHQVEPDSAPVPQAAHCPQDDPGAQARGGETAAADLLLASPPAVTLAPAAAVKRRRADSVNTAPPPPLYARLARLRL